MLLIFVLSVFPPIYHAGSSQYDFVKVCFEIHICVFYSEISWFQINGYKMHPENGLWRSNLWTVDKT